MLEEKLNDFVQDVCNYNKFSKDKTEEIQYVMKLLLYEIIKIIIITILFSLFGYLKEISLILFTMILVKPFAGGYHETSQLKCLIATIIVCCFILLISINSNLNYVSILLLNSINIFSIYHQAPIINDCMPITKSNLIRKNKIIAILNSVVLTIISIFFNKYRVYSNIITWTLTVTVCLMFNSKKSRG